MVMEAQPSPRSVGCEFVRQYYTLLNQSPEHLHRFYSNNSFYVHDGADDRDPDLSPAIGQKQIHQRIEQLNFKDCHAKINQVDSQATLGNGVVVQVSGELSNGGQPMRRFTQTFVLASQSPTKYYVHNDIFRYQDVFFDEEGEQGSGRSETEEDQIEQEHNQVADMQSQQQQNQLTNSYYGGGGNVPTATVNGGGAHHDEVPPPVTPAAPAPHGLPPPTLIQPMPQPAYMPQPVDYMQQQPAQQPPSMELQQPSAVGQQQMGLQQQQPTSAVSELQQPQPDADVDGGCDVEDEDPVAEEDDSVAAVSQVQDASLHNNNYPSLEQEHSLDTSPQSNEPKTYATLVKSGTSGLNTSPQAPPKPSSPPPSIRMESRNVSESMSGGGRGPMGGGGAPRGRGGSAIRGIGGGRGPGLGDRERNSQPPRPTHNDDTGNFGGDFEKRRSGSNSYMHPDTNQLFLGNLPPAATEDDLREMFSKFGTILDLKIMSKGTIKGQNHMINKPNYGFIVFEDQRAVIDTLDKKPFYFDGLKLNVEEKRARNSRGGGGGPPMEPRMSSGGGDIGGGGRGPRGGGGMPGGGGMRGGGNRSYVPNRGGHNYMRGGGGGGPIRPNGPGGGGYNNRAPNNR
ncbi:ras GTPase-activating protein-binding protein 2 [Nilaparvata lugens]|uniref:ras GTPase-activating protein-binding protein 2 n=1 Tax=Nilaparvata lugens TaxID=108931 RepID=UPI00193E369F|nr:ras GTPase-activating protein-binding protein 2 [Nilaparvata lugens]XP_039276265.1 ras GTPase-activating protein-binding protein 2 [Nilaparvata lugens]